MLDKYSSSPVKFAVMVCSTRKTSFLVPSMHPYLNTSPYITQLVQFIESLKCIFTALTEKTGHSPFVWVFHLITLSPSVSRLGLVKMLETSKLLCSAFTLGGCREGGGEKKRWVLNQLKIMRVEGFSSGALLYWTWRTTCTTSTYTFSNASRHGVQSLEPSRQPPAVCATNVSVAHLSDNVEMINAFDVNQISKIIDNYVSAGPCAQNVLWRPEICSPTM